MPATWLPDPSHYPEQMTPLSATTWFEAVGRGLHEAMRELRGPFGGFEARTELGWAYEGELRLRIVARWREDQPGSAPCLLVSGLRIELQPDEVTTPRCVPWHYQVSRPILRP